MLPPAPLQFSRFANAYFLGVCILQAIPEVSITNGIPTTAFPLAFVLFFDAIVTATEDYARHRDDAAANNRKVLVMDAAAAPSGAFVEKQWRDVRVGDVVKVLGGEELPADVVFLSAGHDGACALSASHRSACDAMQSPRAAAAAGVAAA